MGAAGTVGGGGVGAEAIFATLAGGPARRYDDMAVLGTATLGFALGIDTVEGAKHLRRAEAGAVVGLAMTVPLAILLVGAPVALAIALLLWVARRVMGTS